MENFILSIIDQVNDVLWTYFLIALLIGAALWFSIKTKFVQFRMIGEMMRLLVDSGQKYDAKDMQKIDNRHKISSFQAFAVSIASHVGTGNLAGVATAIAVGGPGSIFWMWIVALVGSVNSFIECTLAQLFKTKGGRSFIGGPAYYIMKGLGKRWWAVTFAVLISLTFGLAFNSVQSNAISTSLVTFGVSPLYTGLILAGLTLIIIWGGIQRISRFSEIVVPFMAIAYVILGIVVLCINYHHIPAMFRLIIDEAFAWNSAIGGGIGMAIMMGVKRGLFSNEAGEGSAPNAAATAAVSHPVKQGLIQTLGVFTDTLIICSITAFIILSSGIFGNGSSGIELTQMALSNTVGQSFGSIFIAVAIFFFAFTSIVANYYYGETNIYFILRKTGKSAWIYAYRIAVGAMVLIGSMSSLSLVWGLADVMMAMMTACNLAAIIPLGKYAFILLKDYCRQRKEGLDPQYHSSTIPEIADKTECWSH